MELQIVHRSLDMKSRHSLVRAVHHHNAVVVIGILHMQRLAGLSRTVVASSRVKIVIVEVPYHGRPRVIQHPLHNSRGGVLVAPIRLEHRTFPVIRHRLRAALVFRESLRLAVALLHSSIEDRGVGKSTTATVVMPIIAGWPKTRRGKKSPQTGFRWNGGSRARLCIKTPGAAHPAWIREPIGRRNVVVRTGHLYPALAAHRGLARGG